MQWFIVYMQITVEIYLRPHTAAVMKRGERAHTSLSLKDIRIFCALKVASPPPLCLKWIRSMSVVYAQGSPSLSVHDREQKNVFRKVKNKQTYIIYNN